MYTGLSLFWSLCASKSGSRSIIAIIVGTEVGHRDLFDAFGLRVELPRAVHRVDRRYHIAEAEMVPQHRI
jgi:hypothetical protein